MIANGEKHGLDVRFVDMIASSLSVDDLVNYVQVHRPLVVGFYAFTIKMHVIHHIAKSIKDVCPDVLVCCGGPHASALPKETLVEYPCIDFVVCGEADHIIVDIIREIKNKKEIHSVAGIVTRQSRDYTQHRVLDIDAIPFPAWHAMSLDKYLGAMPHLTKQELPMTTSRGCPFHCVFCARSHGNIRRQRSEDSVISEISYNIEKYQCEAIAFLDETFVINLAKSTSLFNRFIREGISEKIKWGCEGRVDIGTPEFFKLMRAAGCYYMFFGLESGDDEILRIARKGITVKQIRSTVNAAQDAGIVCSGAFIIGLPGETEATAQKSIQLAEELNMYSTTFPIAVPLPGSELRDMALRNEYGLRIMTNDWSLYGKQQPGVMESDKLSMEDRIRLQKEAYARNPKKVLKRKVDAI